jgi:6-phosphogluconolactonase
MRSALFQLPGRLAVAVGVVAAGVALAAADHTSGTDGANPGKLWAYVGTYTGTSSKGIYRFDFDPASGKLSGGQLAAESVNPSFLAVHPNRRFLYAVNEMEDFRGQKTGALSAFAIDPGTGALTLLNLQPSGGSAPCHLVVDREGKHVLAANYGGGSVSVLPIHADGRLGEPTGVVRHRGSSVDTRRQQAPHAHCVTLDAANRFAFVADLGLDMIVGYRFDRGKGTLTPTGAPGVVPAGSGPRHFAFHPDGRHAYAINELKSTMTAFDYDPDHGTLKPLQTLSTLPEGFTGKSWCAEVQVHPSGRFVYGSNRGENSIAAFAVDRPTGRLTAAGHQGHHIKVPRGFTIDPTGTYLLVANQDANSLVVFRINAGNGELTPTGSEVDVPVPVSVEMVPAGR